VSSVVARGGAGQIIKSTGDGLLAVFDRPSAAVERALEIQERLKGHLALSVRIGLDMGEVRVELENGAIKDVFGRHVDWAARVAAMADGGHVCMTKPVHTDAASWARQGRLAWKEHGRYRLKSGEPLLEVFEAFNANVTVPMAALRGERLDAPETPPAPRRLAPIGGDAARGLRLIKPWEAVARDGREFAEKGAGMMYWFKVPLGGVSYPEGFRNFLAPALANPRIAKIRFILDSWVAEKRGTWEEFVLPQILAWAREQSLATEQEIREHGGKLVIRGQPATTVAWVYDDLSGEFTPSFKFFVEDPDRDEATGQDAQIFVATASRKLKYADGSVHTTRVPDAIIRVNDQEDNALLHSLNLVANQWDSMFE